MLNTISYKIKANPPGVAYVNYVANHNTFTLFDMVSYDRKYNEDNGENNNDGAVYNYSWNCGFEGETRKKKVMDLRKKQMKNALALVLLSQGVPMIYAGDEMCNSQKGNNNPYCLDNEISWTNWNTNACAKEIFAYTKAMIKFRKEHKILHMPEELRLMDYTPTGIPAFLPVRHTFVPCLISESSPNRIQLISFSLMSCTMPLRPVSNVTISPYIAWSIPYTEAIPSPTEMTVPTS